MATAWGGSGPALKRNVLPTAGTTSLPQSSGADR